MTLPYSSAASLSDIGQRRQPVGVSKLAIPRTRLEPLL